MNNFDKLISSRCKYGLNIVEMIICEVLKSVVADYVEEFLPINLLVEQFFKKSYIHFYPLELPASTCVYYKKIAIF